MDINRNQKNAINRFNRNEKISRSTKGYPKKIDGKKSKQLQFDLELRKKND